MRTPLRRVRAALPACNDLASRLHPSSGVPPLRSDPVLEIALRFRRPASSHDNLLKCALPTPRTVPRHSHCPSASVQWGLPRCSDPFRPYFCPDLTISHHACIRPVGLLPLRSDPDAWRTLVTTYSNAPFQPLVFSDVVASPLILSRTRATICCYLPLRIQSPPDTSGPAGTMTFARLWHLFGRQRQGALLQETA